MRDAELIRSIQNDDGTALGILLRAYMGWLTDVARPIVGSPDLAQDVVQDVFMRLWDMRASLTIHGSVPAYLYRAVRNRARNVVVHEQSQRNIEARMHDAYDGQEPRARNSGEYRIVSAEFRMAVEAALERLPPRTREIFLMRVEADLSYAEIAETLGIGVPTVHTQMYRATKLLAKHLQAWVDPNEVLK